MSETEHIGPFNRVVSALGFFFKVRTLSKLIHRLVLMLAIVGVGLLLWRDPLGFLLTFAVLLGLIIGIEASIS